ncbi:tyrosine-type recombinase/integrase [Bavariicoccus seileri]|uniref:site-specific integrase n=1 Tax=Bavariicoccus seileri TaxID=549685 RepID=UPI0003B79F6E|nr:tyrosine-type recombinase/integrase [Bavariicoccus seileri]
MSVKQNKKTKKWYCRVSYKDDDGKYKQITRKNFATKTEARLKEAEIKKKVEDGSFFTGGDIPFADYFKKWVARYVSDDLSIGTQKKYKRDIILVEKHFKKTPISKVTRSMYQDFITSRGKGRSMDTVVKTHSHVKKCIKDAIYDGLISKDPTYQITLSADVKPKDESKKYLSEKDANKLLNYVKNNFDKKPDMFLMIILGLTTGMRYGEILALSWKDIDFGSKTIRINKSFDAVFSHNFTSGKTVSSHRTITIDDDTILYLKKFKLMHTYQYLYIDNFREPAFSHNGVSKRLKGLCKQLGIKEITFHSLRHTHASLLIFKGININYVSKRLGHKKIDTTIGTYSHVIDEMEQLENKKVSHIFQSKNEQILR